MDWKKGFLHMMASGVLSIVACLVYNYIYKEAFYVDFHAVLNTGAIIGSCTIGCGLMAISYLLLVPWKGGKFIPWLNILICVLSFISILNVLTFTLPLDIKFPEMFPGLAIPMHFFPALSFFAVSPFFYDKGTV